MECNTLVIGAGPAGLTAAHELLNAGMHPTVLEASAYLGGIARTHVHQGYRFDIGGHRFYTKIQRVLDLWKSTLGPDLISVPRLSRIYYRDRFFNYPLELANTLTNLGPIESLHILASYIRARIDPVPREETFEHWVTNRFGERLFNTFFKTYTEKVWGIPCSQIQAEWAAQRIKGLSLIHAVKDAIFPSADEPKSLIKSFLYPRLGPGMMWERLTQSIQSRGGVVHVQAPVQRVHHDGRRITGITADNRQDQAAYYRPEHLISSMPITRLVAAMDPAVPPAVLEAAQSLTYRAFILVGLIVRQPQLFPDNWLYIHAPHVRVGRIQNFRNWSVEMVPDPQTTSLGMEYFCNEGDDLWCMPDSQLIDLATREISQLRLAEGDDVISGLVIRQPAAYPVYDRDYLAHVHTIRDYMARFTNLQTIGRNGMHRYNNQDHSMLTAMLAVRNFLGESHDLWEVNTDRSYYETFTSADLSNPHRS